MDRPSKLFLKCRTVSRVVDVLPGADMDPDGPGILVLMCHVIIRLRQPLFLLLRKYVDSKYVACVITYVRIRTPGGQINKNTGILTKPAYLVPVRIDKRERANFVIASRLPVCTGSLHGD